MNKISIIFGLVLTGAVISAALIYIFNSKGNEFSLQANKSSQDQSSNSNIAHSTGSGLKSHNNQSQHVGTNNNLNSADISSHDGNKEINQDPEYFNQGLPKLSETFEGNDLHDVLFVSDVMDEMTDNIFSYQELLNYIKKKGYTPIIERKGHKKTGFRQVVKIKEVSDPSRIVKLFYSSYVEYNGNLYFDKLYYGLSPREDKNVFENAVKEINSKVEGKFTRRTIRKDYVKWDFSDGSMIFIMKDYYSRENQQNVVLIGKEWEIH